MVEILSTAQPYPGLRPFYRTESKYFFGREAQIAALYKKLLLRRFVAVVGASGSGKSSLVRAGLQPLLESKANPSWHVYVFRPESAPFRVLADKLLPTDAGGPDAELRRGRLLAMLEHDSDGLTQAVAELNLPDGDRFLLVVDQFEELIRYDQATVDTSLRFIRLLLRSAHQRRLPIHVMITMRLDFLGDCARYPGLTEVINEGQYLVPALDRLQRRTTIVEPARLGAKRIAPELVQTLLNDADDAHDQLPVLQHALMRLWQAAEHKNSDSITLSDYHTIGTLKTALSQHANDVFDRLPADLKPHAEGLFKAITDLDKQGRGIRRPQRVNDIAKVLGLSTDSDEQVAVPTELLRIIDQFRAEPACFLLPPDDETIRLDSTIDITHESLIRGWNKLSGDRGQDGWLHKEAHHGKRYSSLVDAAHDFGKDKTTFLPPATANSRLQWWRSKRPNQYWAQRYGGAFTQVASLLRASERNLKRVRRNKRLLIGVTVVGVLILLGSLLYNLYQTQIVDNERYLRTQADEAKNEADKARAEAETARAKAEQALAERDQAEQAQFEAELQVEQAQLKAELEQQRAAFEVARKRSKLLANQALELAKTGEADVGLALVMEILTTNNTTLPYVPETEQAAYVALQNLTASTNTRVLENSARPALINLKPLQDTLSLWRLLNRKPLLQQRLENAPLALCLADNTLQGITTDGDILDFGDNALMIHIDFGDAVRVLTAAFSSNCAAVMVLLSNGRLVLVQSQSDLSWQIRKQWQVNLNKASQSVVLASTDNGRNAIGVTGSGEIFNTTTASSENIEPKLKQNQPGTAIAIHAQRGLVASEQSTRGGGTSSRSLVYQRRPHHH